MDGCMYKPQNLKNIRNLFWHDDPYKWSIHSFIKLSVIYHTYYTDANQSRVLHIDIVCDLQNEFKLIFSY